MNEGQTGIFDVAIIGAGPAGSSAALALARAGKSVVLLEKATLPRYKTCGGGVLARAFRHLPPGAASVVERRYNSVALNFLGSGMNFIASREKPLVYMTMRADLDFALVKEARQAGARLLERFIVKHLSLQNGFVEIASDLETIRARFVIGADGVHSITAKAAGFPELPMLAPALEHEVHVNRQRLANFSEMPRFDFDTIDAGYAWVFPKKDHLSVGILSTHRTCPDLQSKLANYLQRVGITDVEKTEKHGYLIPLAPRTGPLAKGRVLLVGDAAGLVDPVTAEGISHAIESGQLAAAALVDSNMDVERVGPLYHSLLEQNILGELRAAQFLARILYRHPRIGNAAFRLNGRALCDFAARVVMGEGSYRESMKRPSSYFKLLRLFNSFAGR